jgi:ABC-type multidrug transport system ATPase subunit
MADSVTRPAPKASGSGKPPVPALATRELCKSYGDRLALAPLTLSIAKGQRVALVGHNGSGKTTLLRMAAGLLDASDGTVKVHGARAGSLKARARLAYLSDQPTFYDDLSLWEHLEFVARLHGVEEWEERATELIETIGLADRRDNIPTTFSRGLRQKAAIALAFVRPFRTLLVDEPFVGLDQSGKEALLELFAAAHERGATLIVATHELGFVSGVDRLIALSDGAVTFDGVPADGDVRSLVLPT